MNVLEYNSILKVPDDLTKLLKGVFHYAQAQWKQFSTITCVYLRHIFRAFAALLSGGE